MELSDLRNVWELFDDDNYCMLCGVHIDNRWFDSISYQELHYNWHKELGK